MLKKKDESRRLGERLKRMYEALRATKKKIATAQTQGQILEGTFEFFYILHSSANVEAMYERII